jgi:hypothetical protein
MHTHVSGQDKFEVMFNSSRFWCRHLGPMWDEWSQNTADCGDLEVTSTTWCGTVLLLLCNSL